jgi:hypothetical protein
MFNTTPTIIPPSESMVMIYNIISYLVFIVGLFITLYSIRILLTKKPDLLNYEFEKDDSEDDDET